MATKVIYEKSRGLQDTPFTYCPGCSHGTIHKLVAESLVELDILERTIAIAPVGCSVLAYSFFNCDGIQAAHGRAPAVATGVKRVQPEKIVFSYQGDGDLASIGTAEIIHAAHRGENITVIFVNNAIYGMTGGQMAPTTLINQKTSTSPYGRFEETAGKPLLVSEMLATIPGSAYIERVSVHDHAHILKAKRAIKKAFELQVANKGFTMVEVLAACPIGWGVSPVDSMAFVKDEMMPYYPLGVYCDREGGKA
ncbi:MAG: thiamine pyrophosphate-dependent enzyme [Defluviitaleaceae bacterium]|nr:thiamine pyrophosphate-dependent enzyme [Defluviitaleaceae bacterium]MCL2239335.1 thiamine pyrophosphate-dependent enzyme [Defluviitaleaceae bacterium]